MIRKYPRVNSKMVSKLTLEVSVIDHTQKTESGASVRREKTTIKSTENLSSFESSNREHTVSVLEMENEEAKCGNQTVIDESLQQDQKIGGKIGKRKRKTKRRQMKRRRTRKRKRKWRKRKTKRRRMRDILVVRWSTSCDSCSSPMGLR